MIATIDPAHDDLSERLGDRWLRSTDQSLTDYQAIGVELEVLASS